MTQPSSLRVADLAQNRPVPFELVPDATALAALAQELDLLGLRKVRLAGTLRARGKRDWALDGTLGATVVQPCVVTLDPVTTRIETPVERLFLANYTEPDGTEVEMHEDERTEPLGPDIDLARILAEALALALPLYPRKDEATLGEAVFAAPGIAPMRDEDARPFAGLAGLRDSLKPSEE